jgi:pyrroline-5-carboxylate reductase
MNILFCGCGKMSQAFATVIKDIPGASFDCYSPSGQTAKELAKLVLGQVFDLQKQKHFDVIVLGMKPQQFSLDSVPHSLYSEKTIFISLLGATSLPKILSKLTKAKKVIRLMPNLLIAKSSGTTLGTFFNIHSSEKEFWMRYFRRSGDFFEMNDQEIDQMTLLSGCLPAYYYYLFNEVVIFARSSSLPMDTALEVFISASRGVLSQNIDSKMNFTEMISQVASKGGITQAVLDSWSSEHYKNMFQDGFKKGLERIVKLSGD